MSNEKKTEEPAAKATKSADKNTEKPTKILVAEDSAVNRRIVVHLLSRMGFEVSEHPNGQKAWEEFKKAPAGTYSVIFSDIMMPELDGISFLRNVRQEGPEKEIPFVLLTAMSDRDQILQAKALKVNGYLLKPVEYEKVKKKMEEFFPGRRFPALAS